MPAEAIGRASINSTKAGSFELERRPVSFQLLSLEQPAIMVLHAGLGPARDCFQERGEAHGLVRRPAFFARDAAQGKIHTHQMRPRFPPFPQHGRNQQRAEPGLPVERRFCLPGVPQEGRGQNGRIGLRFRGGAPPCLEPLALLPIRIIDERIVEKLRPGRVAGEDPCAAV